MLACSKLLCRLPPLELDILMQAQDDGGMLHSYAFTSEVYDNKAVLMYSLLSKFFVWPIPSYLVTRSVCSG